jgi:ParB-like chromosome segregation protein Spo0J
MRLTMLARPASAFDQLCEQRAQTPDRFLVDPRRLRANPLSTSLYGDPSADIDDLRISIQEQGILVPIVLTPSSDTDSWVILSGHRRWVCALGLKLPTVPCQVRFLGSDAAQRRAILDYNRQRRKTFSQLMREADVLEELLGGESRARRLANLRNGGADKQRKVDQRHDIADRPNSDDRAALQRSTEWALMRHEPRGRTDATVAEQIGLGGKDQYRQARAIWRLAQQGDARAQAAVAQLDANAKTTNAAYKDLRRRERFTTGFRPTPYDVWAFRHDRAFGVPHPGSSPPGIIAHVLHYFTAPGGLVVDPMAGGGATLDVCLSMGRRCLAYDIDPSRPEISAHDIHNGFPEEANGCDLIFCDPPYHTMLADQYSKGSIASLPLQEWIAFLHSFIHSAFDTLTSGGHLALLLAAQTEKDLPPGYGYLDHVFFAYMATLRAGFCPERRVSCPMEGAYTPQQVQRARREGRMLGQVRDLLIVRKPIQPLAAGVRFFPFPGS